MPNRIASGHQVSREIRKLVAKVAELQSTGMARANPASGWELNRAVKSRDLSVRSRVLRTLVSLLRSECTDQLRVTHDALLDFGPECIFQVVGLLERTIGRENFDDNRGWIYRLLAEFKERARPVVPVLQKLVRRWRVEQSMEHLIESLGGIGVPVTIAGIASGQISECRGRRLLQPHFGNTSVLVETALREQQYSPRVWSALVALYDGRRSPPQDFTTAATTLVGQVVRNPKKGVRDIVPLLAIFSLAIRGQSPRLARLLNNDSLTLEEKSRLAELLYLARVREPESIRLLKEAFCSTENASPGSEEELYGNACAKALRAGGEAGIESLLECLTMKLEFAVRAVQALARGGLTMLAAHRLIEVVAELYVPEELTTEEAELVRVCLEALSRMRLEALGSVIEGERESLFSSTERETIVSQIEEVYRSRESRLGRPMSWVGDLTSARRWKGNRDRRGSKVVVLYDRRGRKIWGGVGRSSSNSGR